MELLIQPESGLAPVLKAIDRATSSVEIVIFRCDRPEVERALTKAARRGVFVHALIAHTNSKGEKSLRELETRLLAAGVTVARTADDLVRYHAKYVLVDRRKLWLLAFNFALLDIRHSRSFGVVTANPQIVQEAARLFEADSKRQSYAPALDTFVVSPLNSRQALSAMIRKAKKELLIYDPKISDPAMVRLLESRAAEGVEIKVIGRLTRKCTGISVLKMPKLRLHTRTIIRDGHEAFVGSQSLRAVELDARREAGIIVDDKKIVKHLAKTFADDWEAALKAPAAAGQDAEDVAKTVARMVVKELPPIAPVVEAAIRQTVGDNKDLGLNPDRVEEAVNEAVKEVLRDVVEEAVEQTDER